MMVDGKWDNNMMEQTKKPGPITPMANVKQEVRALGHSLLDSLKQSVDKIVE
jgi:hypothetical protein